MKKRTRYLIIVLLVMVAVITLFVGCSDGKKHSVEYRVTLKNINPDGDVDDEIFVSIIDGKLAYIPDDDVFGYEYQGIFSDKDEQFFDKYNTMLLNVTENMTLYCKWTPRTYEIDFYREDGQTIEATRTYEYGSTNNECPISEKEGKHFLGWSWIKNSGSASIGYSITPTNVKGKFIQSNRSFEHFDFSRSSRLKVYPIFKTQILKVEYIFDEQDKQTFDVEYGGELPKPKENLYEDKKITGWSYSKDGVNIGDAEIVKSNIKLYPIFKYKRLISFEAKGGNAIEPLVAYEGETVKLPTEVERQYYTFCGWYSNENLGGGILKDWFVTQDVTLYADWVFTTYYVQFHTNSIQKKNPLMYTIETSPALIVDATSAENALVDEPRRQFLGWSTTEGSDTVTSDKALNTSSYYRDINFYAVWKGDNVTFNMRKDGESDTPRVEQYGRIFTLPVVTKKGYTFEGWFMKAGTLFNGAALATDKFVTNKDGKMILPYEDTYTESHFDIYPKMTINTYRVDVVSNIDGGFVEGAASYEYGTVVNIKATPRLGYVFKGYFIDNILVERRTTYTFTLSDSSVEINAIWFDETKSVLVYSQYNNADAGKCCAVKGEGQYLEGEEVTLTVEPQQQYMLDGWYVGEEKVSGDYVYKFNKTANGLILTVKLVDNNGTIKYLRDKADLGALRENEGNKTYIMLDDIDYQNDIYCTIQVFKGQLLGNGHTIKNVQINDIAFIWKNSGTIKDVIFDSFAVNSYKSGGNWGVAVIVSDSYETGAVINCVVKNSSVYSKYDTYSSDWSNFVSAVVGYNRGVVRDCLVDNVQITSENYTEGREKSTTTTTMSVGGIVGINIGMVESSVAKANITTSLNSYGFLPANIFQYHGYANNYVRVGGIAGQNLGGSISRSAYVGDNIAVNVAIRGNIPNMTTYVGGALGFIEKGCNVTDCHADFAKISSNAPMANDVGGFAGQIGGIIERCYARSNRASGGGIITVNGAGSVGGFIGCVRDTSKVIKCVSNTRLESITAIHQNSFCGCGTAQFGSNMIVGNGQNSVAKGVDNINLTDFFDTLYWSKDTWEDGSDNFPRLKGVKYPK